MDFSPLYLRLNTLLKQIQAPDATLLWIHIVASAVSAGLLFSMLRHNFRQSVAIAGVAIFILDRSLLVYTHTFEPEPVLLLLIVAATYFASQNTTKSALAGGIFFGLGILTRPNFVPVLLAIPFIYKMSSKDKIWIKKTILFLLPALGCLGALWIRNATIVGYFSPVVMNPGTVFYEGNNPNSWGNSSIYPPLLNQMSLQYSNLPDYHHQLYREFARKSTGSDLMIPQVNSYWSSKALQFLVDHPARSLRLFSTKILHFFHDFLWHDLSVAYTTEHILKRNWPFSLPFAVVSALAVLGLVILSAQWRRYFLFYAVFASQFLSMIAIYVSARQRISVLFLFVFFACGTLECLLENKRRRWYLIVVLLIVTIPLFIRTDLMREEEHLWASIRKSNGLLAEAYRLRNTGDLLQASQKATQSLAAAPWLLDSRRPANLPLRELDQFKNALGFSTPTTHGQMMDRAVLLLESGRTKEAEYLFEQLNLDGYHLKRDQYQSSEYRFYIARCALENGDKTRAVATLEMAIEESPGDPSVLSYLVALTGNAKYKKQLVQYFGELDAAFFLGKAHLDAGNIDAAVAEFDYLAQKLPEFRKGLIYLAASLSDAGRYEEGAKVYRKAISLNAEPVFEEQRILKIFQQIASAQPSGWNHYSYGVVLRQFGYFEEALAEQNEAANLSSSNTEILGEIAALKKVIAASVNKAPDTPER